MPTTSADAPAAVPLRTWALFLLAALAGQGLLLGNPGYFSHDELQWAARAEAGPLSALAWQTLADWRAFQFRPLTFDLWLLLSRALFATPWAMHAAFVAMGTAIGAGLLSLLARLRVPGHVAAGFALAFVLGPVASYTHGWVATLADLLWVGAGVLGANLVLAWRGPPVRHLPIAVAVALLTTLALLAKEAAVVLPALAGFAWLLSGRRREWLVALLASGVPVAVYLALRVGVILFSPRPEGVYAWSFLSIPKQWLVYQLYPLVPSALEAINTMTLSTTHLATALLLLAAMWVFLARANWRAAAWGLIGGALALGPVLILEFPSNQYAYAQSVVFAGALAVSWPRLARVGRVLVVLVLLVSVWHGFGVARHLHSIGERQARFSPQLAAAVARAGGAPVRVRLTVTDDWLYRRLAHQIPAYAGVPIGDRVVLLGKEEPVPADYSIREDGSLEAVR